MTRLGKWIVTLGLWIACHPSAALACVYADSYVVYDLLGSSSAHPASELVLPRNVAFAFWNRGVIPQLVTVGPAAPVELELLGTEPEIGRSGLLTPRTPLEPGVQYSFGASGPFTVADYLDTEAPQPARILRATFTVSEPESACGGSSCGESAHIRARVVGGEDDHTPVGALTFVMYVGETAEAALTTQSFDRLVLTDEQGEIGSILSTDWADRDVFVSVSTLDHAGNESARSEPVRVHSGAAGCGIARGANFGSFLWVVAALLWHALSRRKRWERHSAQVSVLRADMRKQHLRERLLEQSGPLGDRLLPPCSRGAVCNCIPRPNA